MTIRELVGLVAAVALSNAFLGWMDPWASRNVTLFIMWNGMLAMYLGFVFLQGWGGSVIRWTRTGSAEPPGRPRSWTALGVAEATVIGGTMLGTAMLMLVRARATSIGQVGLMPLAILLVGTVAAFLTLNRRRRIPQGLETRPVTEIQPDPGLAREESF